MLISKITTLNILDVVLCLFFHIFFFYVLQGKKKSKTLGNQYIMWQYGVNMFLDALRTFESTGIFPNISISCYKLMWYEVIFLNTIFLENSSIHN